MKKTITTILALAACAHAASIATFEDLKQTGESSDLFNGNGVITANKSNYLFISNYGDSPMPKEFVYGISFTLNTYALDKASASTVVFSANSTKGTMLTFTLGQLVNYMGGGDSITIVAKGSVADIFNANGKADSIASGMDGLSVRIDNYTLNTDLIYAATVMYNKGGSEYFDDSGWEGPIFDSSSLAHELAAATPSAPTPAVPEPATATLSLLALAALASRRRRK